MDGEKGKKVKRDGMGRAMEKHGKRAEEYRPTAVVLVFGWEGNRRYSVEDSVVYLPPGSAVAQ